MLSRRSRHVRNWISPNALIASAIQVLLAFSLATITARAETVSQVEMTRVCTNWLSAMVHEQGNWAGSLIPRIKDAQTLYAADTAVGVLYSIEPSGFVLVPFLKALPPITAYSEESNLDVGDSMGLVQLFRDMLRVRFRVYAAQYGSLNAALPKTAGLQEPSMWDVYTLDDQAFASRLGTTQPMTQGEVLLGYSNWNQSAPWNLYCPPDEGCTHCPVGCVATSASQIMRYWEWPPQGHGSHCYFWQGIQNSGTLCASFDDPYDWANMPLKGQGTWTPDEQNALAELSYEVGVAFEMGYGCDGSGASTFEDVWSNYFWYDPFTYMVYRGDYTAEDWFDIIVSECEQRRPMQFSIYPLSHALVCDGWRVLSGNQIHMNYGWGGSTTAWYFIDNIYGSDPAYEWMRVGIRPLADSFYVRLSVQSVNPSSGVAISVIPLDTNSEGSGSTPFTRKYSPDRLVTLEAPLVAGGNSFVKWQRDGADYPGGPSVQLSLERNHTMTAVFLSCTEAVGQPWVTPRSPECINTTYSVNWNRILGAESYEIRENGGTWAGTGTDTSKSFSPSAGGSYWYEVRAVSACGQGAASAPVTVIVESNAPSSPEQPWADPSDPVCVNSQYTVNWNPTPGADGYEIRENGGGWQSLGLVTVWYGTNSAAGIYTYEIRAVNACGSSGPSPSVAVAVTAEGSLPSTPGQPWAQPASPVCVNRQFTVRWSPVPAAESYQIRENGGEWRDCGAATMWGVIKSVRGLYSYEVRALNGCGESVPSPTATVTVGSCYGLIVYSSNPTDGVPIVVNPLDQDGQGNAPTPFARTYGAGATVTLQAPMTFNGTPFQRWLRDGADYGGSPTIAFDVDMTRTMTAIYGTCDCPHQGDLDSSGFIDVSDVLKVIGIAFVNGADVQDPNCPETRGDVNNSGVVDVNDVLYIIKTAFTNGPPPVDPCL